MSARTLRSLVPGKLDELRLSPEARAELIVWRESMSGVGPPNIELIHIISSIQP